MSKRLPWVLPDLLMDADETILVRIWETDRNHLGGSAQCGRSRVEVDERVARTFEQAHARAEALYRWLAEWQREQAAAEGAGDE